MSKSNEMAQGEEALELIRDFAIIETKMEIVNIISKAANYEEALDKLNKFCTMTEEEYKEYKNDK